MTLLSQSGFEEKQPTRIARGLKRCQGEPTPALLRARRAAACRSARSRNAAAGAIPIPGGGFALAASGGRPGSLPGARRGP